MVFFLAFAYFVVPQFKEKFLAIFENEIAETKLHSEVKFLLDWDE